MRRTIFLITCFLLTAFSVSVPAKQVRPVYPVELLPTIGGRITPNVATVRQGAKHVRFSIKPEKGFAIADVTFNGASRGIASTLTVPVVSGPLRVEATFVPGFPTVDAGQDAGGYAGIPLTLHGSAVPAVPGDSLKYDWKVVKKDGSGSATVKGRHSASPTFLASKPGVYEVQLRVTEQGNEAIDTLTIDVNLSPKAFPPEAKILAEPVIVTGQEVAVSGYGSYDPLGLPLSYSWQLKSRPPGSSAELNHPSSTFPRFTPDVPGEYVVSLTVANAYASGTVTARITAKSIVEPNLLDLKWEYRVPGTLIGRDGLHIVDLDGDNKAEIVVTAYSPDSCSFFYIMRRLPDGSYEQTWTSESYSFCQSRLLVADLDADGRPEIIVGHYDGVRIFKGDIPQEVRRYPVANLQDVAVADLDGDGTVEIATTNGYQVSVFSARDGELKWSLHDCGGKVLKIGNVDDDPELEIVTTSGLGKGYVIDTSSQTVQWEYSGGFGSDFVLADVDGDGKEEIVQYKGEVVAFDAEVQQPSFNLPQPVDVMTIADIDRDGTRDMIIGITSEIVWLDRATFGKKWSLLASDPVRTIAVGDVDGDGENEVVFGTDYSLVIASPTTGIEWRLTPMDGPLNVVDVADVDNDGKEEIVMASANSEGYLEEGVLHVFDASTHRLKYRERLGFDGSMGAKAVYAGDIDGDGRNEIVVASSDYSRAIIRIFDGTTKNLKGKKELLSDGHVLPMAVADLENDGRIEIVVPQKGDNGWYLLVLDGDSLEEKWRSGTFSTFTRGDYIYDVKVSDVNGDGISEILASVPFVGVYVYDGKSRILKNTVYAPSLALAFTNGAAGRKDIVVGRSDGKISIIDGGTLKIKNTIATASSDWIFAIRAKDVTGDGKDELIFAQDSRLWIFDQQGESIRWMSERLFYNLGTFNYLVVEDTDGDGRNEIIVGGPNALYHFGN